MIESTTYLGIELLVAALLGGLSMLVVCRSSMAAQCA
jgi:hypothetical protein